MLKRILVPLDGSPLAEAALAPATALAERFGAEVFLVRTILVPVFPGTDPGPAQGDAQREAEGYLERVSRRVKAAGVAVQTAIPSATPSAGITDQARFHQVDLIIMSTHARKWVDALLHPSVTLQVLEHTPAPLLAWKPAQTAEADVARVALPRYMTDPTTPIVVPLDGSLLAERALPLAEGMAGRFGNPLVLVSIADIPTGPWDYPYNVAEADRAVIQETQRYLTRKQQEIVGRGLRVEAESAIGAPATAIADCVQRNHAGLVVMAAHGHGGLGHRRLGSVAELLLQDTETPVLLVRFHPTASGAGK